MASMGTYDPATYVSGDTSTYPELPPGIELYQPGMFWDSIGYGTIDGQAAQYGDLIYVIGAGREYGDFTYGELVYGNPPDRDWPVELVGWLVWDSTVPPSHLVPFPFSGCPFTRADTPGGNWAPGWNIVVDAYYNAETGSRTYGGGTYGSDVYGDLAGAGAAAWHDLTRPSLEVTALDGSRDGRATVDTAELIIRLVDDVGEYVDIAPPFAWFRPAVGSPIRVGFLDPQQRYWPVHVGIIERIRDDHDRLPRFVEIQAFGQVTELVSDVAGWQRPAELMSTRFAALLAAAGWRFGTELITFPYDVSLLADVGTRNIIVRQELDRTVQSGALFLDSDRWGDLRLRPWPILPGGDPLEVVDCDEDTAALLSPLLRYIDDEAELLNVAVITNDGDPITEVRGESATSIARYGRRSRSLGFPRSGLAFATTAVIERQAAQVVGRYSAITKRVDQVVADTKLDPAWLAELVALDTGRAVRVERTAIRPFVLDAVAVGWEHSITPGRWRSTIYTSTTSASF